VDIEIGTLNAYTRAAAKCGRGHYFGGPLFVRSEREPPQWIAPYLSYSLKGLEKGRVLRSGFTQFIGPNWALFAEDLLAIGGFDERRGPGAWVEGDETDGQLRLWLNGCQPVVVEEAVATHVPRQEVFRPEAILRRVYRQGLSHGLNAFEGVGATRRQRVLQVLDRLKLSAIHAWTSLRAVFDRREVTRFAARYQRALLSGFAMGWCYGITRHAHQNRPRPPA
jgi:hypothetical protein